MSVHVLYRGKFGNRMFQYVCARLFADKTKLHMATPFPEQDLVRMAPPSEGAVLETPTVTITDGHDPLAGGVLPPARYVFDGYFQDSAWYHACRTEILSFAVAPPPERRSSRDIVLSLRIGQDYRTLGWVIHPSWYLGILATEKFDTLHVVTDVRDEGYLAHFARYRPVIVSSGPKGDWDYLRSFERMISSNSTFAWWAAFMGRATRVWTFRRWVTHPMPRISHFPGGSAVDGPFLHEADARR